MLLLPPFPFPQARPALVTPKSDVVAAALVVKCGWEGWDGGPLGAGKEACGSPGDGRAGRQCPRRGDRAFICVSSTFLSEASAAAARDAPKECHVHPQGRVWGSRHVSSQGPQVFLSREELLLLPTPVRTYSFTLLPCV